MIRIFWVGLFGDERDLIKDLNNRGPTRISDSYLVFYLP